VGSSTYLSGVADFDPVNQRYFFVSGASTLITMDAQNGQVLHSQAISNPNSAVSPLTNMAYNWLNDTLYGLEYKTNSLRLVSVDPASGNLNMISPAPISIDGFSQGNSDIDPVGRRYFYVRGNILYTIDLETGQALHQPTIQLPDPSAFFMNMAYNWLNDSLYGLYFVPNYFSSNDPFALCTGGLFFASVDPVSGAMTVISQAPTSPDCFQGNVCDIDPVNQRYVYLRSDTAYTINILDGSVMSQTAMTAPGSSITDITNIAFNEAFSPPANAIQMDMGSDTLWLEPGQTMTLNAYVGNQPQYIWSDGVQGASREIGTAGTYSVQVGLAPFSFSGSVVVATSSVSTFLSSELPILNFRAFPNPARAQITVNWEGKEQTTLTLRDLQGRILKREVFAAGQGTATWPVQQLPAGIYLLQMNQGEQSGQQRVLIIR
ncbi:MAG: T9SS type A sorting domain-containing protein, partial [Bacteroidota bacterium]